VEEEKKKKKEKKRGKRKTRVFPRLTLPCLTLAVLNVQPNVGL
jgi:hypothetical protein